MEMIQMTPMYSTKIFTEIWGDETEFISDIKDSGLNKLSDDSLHILFRLLFARYGNSPISNMDENQFKAKVAAIIFQYGPTWEKRVEIQDKIRALKEDELLTGSKQVFNSAYNPDTAPSTQNIEELQYVSEQKTALNKRSKLEGYSLLLNLLETDVTEEFISRFRKCFVTIVAPQHPLFYVTEEEGE